MRSIKDRAKSKRHQTPIDRELLAFAKGADAAERFRPKALSHLLLLTIVVLFGVMLTWASRATLEEVTRGDGRVIPSRRVQVVQNLEGGIVEEILVREGEIVEPGQVLMRIDNIQAASDYREKRARYLNLQASIARLQAEVNETGPVFSEDVLEAARDVATNEQALFNLRQAQLQDELEVLREQTLQREQELVELRTKLEGAVRSLALAKEELALTEPMARQRLVSQTDFLKIRREVNDLDAVVEQTRLTIPRAEAALREAHGRIESVYSSFHSAAQRELNLKQSELASLRETIAAGEDQVRRTAVRAPLRGTIKQINFNTIGGVIKPGEDLLEIVPLEDSLLVEASVRPADIAFLRPGLPAKVKITAYDFSLYGGLDGEVEQISADTITNDRGESFYKVRVRTDRNYLGTEEDPLGIIPGMTAQVDVLTGEKTVLDYLIAPIARVQDRALRER